MQPADMNAGPSPDDLPVYASARAAGLVRLPLSTLRQWALGDGVHEALFKPASRAPLVFSFSNLIEAFVLASMRRVHGISMQRVRKALRFVGSELDDPRPLTHARFRMDGMNLFVQHAGRLLDVSAQGQAVLLDVLNESLDRIDWEGGSAARLYPWVREGELKRQPRLIVVDPRRSGGQPVIAATGIEARVVAARFRAGEPISVLATEYGVDVESIEDAIRCELFEGAQNPSGTRL